MEKQTVGGFISTKLVEVKREVAHSNNVGGYASIYAKVAQMVKDEFPDLTEQQKAQVFSNLEHDAELTTTRTRQDVRGGLASAAHILGLRRTDSKIGAEQLP